MAQVNVSRPDFASITGGTATLSGIIVLGGRYAFSVAATWGGGNVVLNQLMPDGSTYVAATSSFTSNASTLVDLPPGSYQIAITTATAVVAALVRVPYRAA